MMENRKDYEKVWFLIFFSVIIAIITVIVALIRDFNEFFMVVSKLQNQPFAAKKGIRIGIF